MKSPARAELRTTQRKGKINSSRSHLSTQVTTNQALAKSVLARLRKNTCLNAQKGPKLGQKFLRYKVMSNFVFGLVTHVLAGSSFGLPNATLRGKKFSTQKTPNARKKCCRISEEQHALNVNGENYSRYWYKNAMRPIANKREVKKVAWIVRLERS